MSSSMDFLTRPAGPAAAPARRFPAWLLPAGILAGFALIFAALYRDRLLPAPEVEVATVLATSEAAQPGQPVPAGSASAGGGNADVSAGAALFQASGWVEPDPYPVKVPALIDGVVAEVLVLEGQLVEKSQVLATLVDADAKLALAASEGRRKLLESSRLAHLSALEAATKKRIATQAEAEAARASEAEASQRLAKIDRVTKEGAVSQIDIISARLSLQREKALYQAAQAKDAELTAEVQRMERETQAKEDEIALAVVAVDQARLALERTRIHAPVKGRVLRLMAAPGDKKMLSMDHADSSVICSLYEPDKLQVRVDVPLADAAKLQPGQRVKIHTSLLSARTFDGEVTRITGEADLQRNTLQAKVRIIEPAEQLRPEVLCRVEFFAMSRKAGAAAANVATGSVPHGAALAIWIPAAAVQGDAVWVCDPESKRLTKRAVRLTGDNRDGFLRAAEGVRPGEQVVTTAGDWREGQRVDPKPAQP